MTEKNVLKEWTSNEILPSGFTEWLKITIREIETQHKKEFRQIAYGFGVKPAFHSRWIGGMGPMMQTNIQMLACNISPVVYTYLGLPRPINEKTLAENIIELDQVPPFPLQ
ncbi:hypothetical protein ACFLY4_03085 [Chloroflexota bacterium]